MQQRLLLLHFVIIDSIIGNLRSHWFNKNLEGVFTTTAVELTLSIVTPQNTIEEQVMEKQCPTTSVGMAQ